MAKPRKGRSATDYVRRGPQREAYEYILLVCEGKKTEPNYLNGLRVAYRLSNANIKVVHPNATDPMSIVKFGETELAREDYDRVYCVFDRDGHTNYDAALRRVEGSQDGKSGRLCVAVSVPCFEVWLLLHFRYSAAPFAASGKLSACDRVLRDLEAYIPNYRKGQVGVFNALALRMNDALANAARLEVQNQASCTMNPSTGIHRMIIHLRDLK